MGIGADKMSDKVNFPSPSSLLRKGENHRLAGADARWLKFVRFSGGSEPPHVGSCSFQARSKALPR
jgi:hypothetical protein